MGRLREESRWPESNDVDAICTDYGVKLDYPQAPAHILLDDLEQEMVTDMGLDLDEGLYMYKIEEYPESHHL